MKPKWIPIHKESYPDLEKHDGICSMVMNTPLGCILQECKAVLEGSEYVDYLRGRVIKCNFEDFPNKLSLSLFDRDNGQGAGAKAIAAKEAELGLGVSVPA